MSRKKNDDDAAVQQAQGLQGSARMVDDMEDVDFPVLVYRLVALARGCWVVLPKNMAVLEKVPKGRPHISITKGGSLKKLIGNRNGAAPQAQIRCVF